MSDFEIEAASREAMIAAAKLIGAWDEETASFKTDAPGWALNVYGTREDRPGYFAIARWLRDGDPPQLPPELGVVVRPLPEDSPYKWA